MLLVIVVILVLYFWWYNQENYMDLPVERFIRRNSSYDLRGDIYQPQKEFVFNNSELTTDNSAYRHKDGDY